MATLKEIEKALLEMFNGLPQQIGMLAVNFSKQRFVAQAWHDTAVEPWEKRKRPRRGGKKRQQGAVLVDSGRLKRSIRIVAVTPTSVTIGTDVPYAQIHNDGYKGTQQVKAHTENVKGHTENVKEHKRNQKVKYKNGKTKTKIVNVKAHIRHVKAHIRHVKAHPRNMNMPRRRFLGESAELERQITEFILGEIQSAIDN